MENVMFLTFNSNLRSESDASIITTLKRKGWEEAPRPTFNADTEGCIWIGGAWVIQEKSDSPPKAQSYQVRAWLIRNGISLDAIPSIIEAAISSGPQRDEALMRWEYVDNIPIDHPLVTAVAAQLGLEVSAIWPEILGID